MTSILHNVLNDEQGQGLAEYGLILALVAVLAVTALGTLSTAVNATLTAVAGKL
jgi:pilus assembly protein Flp/PilA